VVSCLLSFRHKKVKVFENEFKIGPLLKRDPLWIHREEILNAGKVNHRIHGSFVVKGGNESNLTIKCYILTDLQFVEWAEYFHAASAPVFVNPSKGSISDPQNYIYSSIDALPKGNFDIKMGKENVLYFILDNRFSALTSKNVQLVIWEEWDESILPIDVVTTTPPQDTSIDDTTNNMILSAKKELKILSPYIDMYLVKSILEQHEKGIQIFIITRDITEVSRQKSNTQALSYIQKTLGVNHKVNPFVHSRIIIRDEIDALVSSADLTRDSLRSHYNAGIILAEPNLVQKLLNYFNQVFRDSGPMSQI